MDNKKMWTLVIVVIVLILLVIGLSKLNISNNAIAICKPGDFYNSETGKLCPGKTAPGPCETPGDIFNKDTGERCPVATSTLQI